MLLPTASEADQLKFACCIMKNSEMNIDWKKVADEWGFSLASSAQRRFKSIVEKAGFKLENGKQITGGAPLAENASATAGTYATTNGNSAPLTPKNPRKKAELGSSAKRRKSTQGKAAKSEDEEGQEDTVNG